MGIVGNMGFVGKRGRERLSVLCCGYPFRAENGFLARAAPTVTMSNAAFYAEPRHLQRQLVPAFKGQ
jgi:hypothetical protein